MWAAGLTCHVHRDFARSAILDNRVIDIKLCLSVKACSTFAISTLGCLDNMQVPGTMVQFMWQADMRGVARVVTNCLGVLLRVLDVFNSTDPYGGGRSGV